MDGAEEQENNSNPQHSPAFQRYHKILKMMEQKDNYDLIADTFVDEAKFKESDQAKYDTPAKKKQFLWNERKKILFTCVFQLNTQYTQFDQFTMAFYNWLNLPTTKFPIQRKEVQAYVKQRKNEPDKQKDKEKQKEKEKQKQIERQKQVQREKEAQDQLRQRQKLEDLARREKVEKQAEKERIKAYTAELQRKKQQMQQRKIAQQQHSAEKMVDQGSASKNQVYRQNQQRSPVQPRPMQAVPQNSYPRAQQTSTSPSPIQNIPANQPSQQLTPASRVIARSPNPTSNNQRFDGEVINRNRNDVYHFSKPDISREDQIKKILNKISECYQHPEKRFKTQADIKLDLDHLRRIEDVERANNSQRGGRSDRK